VPRRAVGECALQSWDFDPSVVNCGTSLKQNNKEMVKFMDRKYAASLQTFSQASTGNAKAGRRVPKS
jgi:hypothetical protein